MTHRTPARSGAPIAQDRAGAVVFDAVCAPIVIGIAIAIVAHVFDQISATAGLYVRWTLYTADAAWGVAMLWLRLRGLRRNSVTPQHDQED